MNNSNIHQKKRIATNYILATLIGLLVLACAITIALVSTNKANSRGEVGGDNPSIPVANDVYVLPMRGATISKDFSAKELQFNDTLKQWEIHKAIDFKPGEDLNVYAVADGVVSNVYTNHLEGTVIEIAHKNGLVSVYKSLEKEVSVKVGDKVSAASIIGKVADSMAQELNTGAHLHFEFTSNGAKVDPNNYLSLGDK